MRFLSVIVLLALTACTRPYATPFVEGASRAPGLLDLLETEVATLAASPPGAPSARVIATHGMCSHQSAEWVAKRLALYESVMERLPHLPDPLALRRVSEVETTVARLRTRGGHEVELVLLRWGHMVDDARATLVYDSGQAPRDVALGIASEELLDPERGSLTGPFRVELVNRCLVDAAVYMGRAGDAIRHAMRQALCEALGGRPDRTTGGAEGAPGTRMACARDGAVVVPVVLVPESLGSIILLDAFAALGEEAEGLAAETRGEVRGIYLISNQIPLLSLANPDAPGPAALAGGAGAGDDPLRNFLRLRALAPQPARTRPLPIVALTDPNDFLSYRLHPERYPRAEAMNVLVSNGPTILGLFSHPLRAHEGYERDQVFDIVLFGWPDRRRASTR